MGLKLGRRMRTDGYVVDPNSFDEMFASDGSVRDIYAPLAEHLSNLSKA